MNRQIKLFLLAVFSLAAFSLTSFSPGAFRLPFVSEAASGGDFRSIIDTRVQLAPGVAHSQVIHNKSGALHSITVSLPDPALLAETDTISFTLRDGARVIARRTLHHGDPDFYLLFRATSPARLEITSAAAIALEPSINVVEWPSTKAAGAITEAEPNDTWNEANEFQLGQTVWAAADDKPYIAPAGDGQPARGAVPYAQQPDLTTDRLPEGGIDWYKFTWDGDPRLVHFELTLLERDNIPVDVSIFRVENNEAKPYERGMDPVTPPHEVQALPGNKFTPRIVTRGTYYVRVDANHPFYQLRTSLYDPPPYGDPRKAVRAGMDYLISAGDSWHANTPRHGGIVNRVSNNHHETQLCIACHATHFTTRGGLTAIGNGYNLPDNKRPALQFLTERLANNPLPFYGFPDAAWTRVISASANVMSRLAILVNQYDQQSGGQKRLELLRAVAGYLKLNYRGVTELPRDESNGNTPLVSAYEVAWYSWKVFHELYKTSGENEYREYRDRIRALIEQDKIKNVTDLCYQTIAFADMDNAGYAERMKRNGERLLSLQRADGQWSMLFEKDSPAVEFATYHALYALARVGFAPEHPQIAKSLKRLLERQQEYGAWFDPKQSYENFGTPFRETQFAVMALSEFYREQPAPKPRPAVINPVINPKRIPGGLALLQFIDATWPGKATRGSAGQMALAVKSSEPMVRMAAAAALGRLRTGDDALRKLLGDRSRLVQLAAAQALRRAASGTGERTANPGQGLFLAELSSGDERTRWGAARVFAQHFKYLTGDIQTADKMIALLGDASARVRMQAAKSLTQWFYWTRDAALKDRIADALVARLAVNEHPWVRRNLQEALYSVADENVRYLYNNWIGQLPQKEDRERATAGHRAESRKMAERLARALETGNETQRTGLLEGLTGFHLRSGGYVNAGRYTRIGNDVETVVFYADGAPAMERALTPLINAPDAARRRQAIIAAYSVRDNALPALPLLVMQRLTDDDATVRAAADEVYRLLPLRVTAQNRVEASGVIRQLLSSKYPEARIAALDRVRALGDDRRQFDAAVRDFTLGADARVGPAALRALADFPHLARDGAIQQRLAAILRGASAPDADNLLRGAAELVLRHAEWRSAPAIAAALDSLLKTESVSARKLLCGLLTPDMPVENDLRLVNLLTESLEDRDENVRSAALGAVRRVKALQSNAGVRAAVAKLTKDPNMRLQGLAIAIYQGQDGNVSLDLRAAQLLDYNYFAVRVAPLLARRGPDGNACVNCHSNHAIFKLSGPETSGRFTEAQLQDNYRNALKIVDLINPENSLFLRKPIGDAAQEGLVGARVTPHGGGRRWPGPDDPAYQTVLEWINGAKLRTSEK
ncbi:MAG: hypothetical protein ACKV2V_17145 [Blastocatellia bacterium]